MPFVLPAPGQDDRQRGGVWMSVVGRLRSGVSLASADAEMQTIGANLRNAFPRTNANRSISVIPLHVGLVGTARNVVWLLAGATVLVLLIACANIGNLLLANALDRRREFAVRGALGAGTRRLAQLVLAESGALAVTGAVLGLLLAPVLIQAFVSLYPGGLPRSAEVGINLRVLLATLAATLLVTLAAALPPLRQTRRNDLQSVMRAGERGLGSRSERTMRAALIVGQIALSATLLIASGLLLRTLLAVMRTDPGFTTEQMLSFNVDLSSQRYSELAQEAVFHETFLARIRAMPGVSNAGASSLLPLAPGEFRDGFIREGHDDQMPNLPVARLHNITGGYLETLGIPLRAGRTITAADRGDTPPVLVVNETFQERYFPDGAVGKRIRFRGRMREIVGVVADKRHENLRAEPGPDMYLPIAQNDNPRWFSWYAVRVAGDAAALMPAVRNALREIDPALSIAGVATMQDRLNATLAPDRFRASMIGALAALGLALAALGIYAVIAWAVARERREIAIRLSLGDSPAGAIRRVLSRALALAATGTAIGVVLALATGRFIAAFVPEVGPRDPVTLSVVPVLFLGIAALAAFTPALRASRVEPAAVLRAD